MTIEKQKRQARLQAERSRRLKHRQQHGIVVVDVEVDGLILDMLIHSKWITEACPATIKVRRQRQSG